MIHLQNINRIYNISFLLLKSFLLYDFSSEGEDVTEEDNDDDNEWEINENISSYYNNYGENNLTPSESTSQWYNYFINSMSNLFTTEECHDEEVEEELSMMYSLLWKVFILCIY